MNVSSSHSKGNNTLIFNFFLVRCLFNVQVCIHLVYIRNKPTGKVDVNVLLYKIACVFCLFDNLFSCN